MEPDVGIVMPVYRQDSKLFEEAIESIINQTYPYFQLVIVIDGITPNVDSIAKAYALKDTRITLIRREENRGTDVALNIGFQFLQNNTNIHYLTWVSSDNIYYPDFAGVLKEQLENSPQHVGLAYGCFDLIDDNGNHNEATDSWNKRLNQPKEKLINEYFIGYAFMYRKVFAQKIEGYRYMPVEDYDYFLRLTEHCDITFVPQKLMAFRLSSPYSNSIQINNSLEKKRKRNYLLRLVMKEARQRRERSRKFKRINKKNALTKNQYTGPTIANNRIIVYIPFNNLNVQQTLPKDADANQPEEHAHLTEEWISKRMNIFMNFTLKSLINQSNQNYLAFIVYQDSSRQFIEKELQNYPNLPFNIRFVSSSEYEEAVIKTLNGYKYFYELHLHSDDAYHKNFIEQLYHYRPSPQTKVLICQNGYIYYSITEELGEYYNFSSSFNCLIYKAADYLKGVRHNIFQPSDTGIWTGAINLPHEIISDRVYINHAHETNSAFFLEDEKRQIWRNKKGEALNSVGKTISDNEEKQRILQEFLGPNYKMGK
ncbi:glycosyltransferase [Virgibacillus doumboii]|uniref:glycosyltransferase n=1 Tax=Virgibacillus doumboii TaxID=2697503 RepID=UPI0013DF639C|nr:glycosyltransferase [Virgibacillus doumboii]